MTIHLPEDLENSLRAEVDRGRFPSLDEALAEAARLLLRHTSRPVQATDEASLFDVLDRSGLIGVLEGSHDSPTDSSTNPIHADPTIEDLIDDEAIAYFEKEADDAITLEEVRAATSRVKDSMARVVIEEERAERF
jgi:Arc/MetJ-type ribon-helix-helix transcriptional regulator